MNTILYTLLLIWVIPQWVSAAPPPGYTLVFDSKFDGQECLAGGTGWGPITGPIMFACHTPYSGDFGSSYFTGPGETNGGDNIPNPFGFYKGCLFIHAYHDDQVCHWRSGLISTMDYAGNGFAQALGYWECALAWDGHSGTWPAFWLCTKNMIPKAPGYVAGAARAEIDILEAYGVDPTIAHENLHVYGVGAFGKGNATSGLVQGSGKFHVYGCLVNPDLIHFYIDGKEVWSVATPPSALLPMYAMVDLAMGGGWPINETPNPSKMAVSYLRCYAPPAAPSPTPK